MSPVDRIQEALRAAQRHADQYHTTVPVVLINPNSLDGADPAAPLRNPGKKKRPSPVSPTAPVAVPPPAGIQLRGPRAMPDRKVARAQHGTEVKHEVQANNVREYDFDLGKNKKRITVTLADVQTTQGTKTSAYIGSHYLCDFAHTPVGYACILRRPDGKGRIETGSPIPSEYQSFYCVDYRQVTGYSGSGVPDNVLSVVVPIGDSASVAAVAIRRWLAKRSK